MSTSSRGKAAEDLAREELEREGWLVEQCKPTNRVRWSREANNYVQEPRHDFFRCIDLIAVKPWEVLMVQVTHASGVAERVKKIRELIPARILTSEVVRWEVWEKTKTAFVVHPVGVDDA